MLSIINNISIFKRNWAYLHQNMSGKYRVSYIGAKTTDLDYLKSSKEYKYEAGVYIYTNAPHLVPFIQSDVDLSNFYIVNGNFSSSKYEVLDYYSNKVLKCDGIKYMQPPQNLPDSVTSGAKEVSIVCDCFTNIPVIFDEYIHRSELETELQSVLLDEERYPIVTLKGRGGIGKTSLAINVINSILQSFPNRFKIIIWFSARDIDLTAEGPKQVKAVVINQKDISMEYYKQIGETKCSSKNVIEEFSHELTANSLGKALYVFDNFETLSNPVEIYEWLNTFIRNPNKILITSRLNRNFKADYPVEVNGMTEQQCRELINNVSHKLGIDDLLDERYVSKLIEESDGHPYIIKIILGEVARNNRITEIKRIVADKDTVLDSLFKRTYSTLSIAAKRVFLTLCSWRSVIPYIAIESVILRSENEKIDFDATIEELEKSSLIEVVEREDDFFISVPLAASIYGEKELDVSQFKIQIMNDKKLLMEFGAGTARGKNTLQQHLEKKVKALNERLKTKEDFLHEIPSLECLASKNSRIWEDIASFCNRFGLIEKEIECYREELKVENDSEKKLYLWKKICQLGQSTCDWECESSALLEIVNLPIASYEDISNAAYRINRYYSENSGVYDTTKKDLIQTIISKMENRINEATADDCSRLAWLFLNMQDEGKALKYAKCGLVKDAFNTHCKKLLDKLST